MPVEQIDNCRKRYIPRTIAENTCSYSCGKPQAWPLKGQNLGYKRGFEVPYWGQNCYGIFRSSACVTV